MNQAGCLNLVTNAVVTWSTVYMAAVIDRLRAEGKTVNDEDIARLSPARLNTSTLTASTASRSRRG